MRVISNAQRNARDLVMELLAFLGWSNAKLGAELGWDGSMVGRWLSKPALISPKARIRIHAYWCEMFLQELPFDQWIRDELNALREAAIGSATHLRKHTETHLAAFRTQLCRVPTANIQELAGAKYLLGLTLFILFTSRDVSRRPFHKAEMLEALELLEGCLALGKAHGFFSEYMMRRFEMQIDGGYYNLHEGELLGDPSVLLGVQKRLRHFDAESNSMHDAVANVWRLHELLKRDATPLHNGVVFCCTLGSPTDIAEAKRFVAKLIKLDPDFRDPMFLGHGLSALGKDPMVMPHLESIYPMEQMQ